MVVATVTEKLFEVVGIVQRSEDEREKSSVRTRKDHSVGATTLPVSDKRFEIGASEMRHKKILEKAIERHNECRFESVNANAKAIKIEEDAKPQNGQTS